MSQIEKNTLEMYEIVNEEIKYLSNSLIRLDILTTIFHNPKTMKDINSDTGLSYSSISSNIHNLEINDYVVRDLNRYYLSNIMEFYLDNILKVQATLDVLNKFKSFFNNHNILNLPKEVMGNIFLLDSSYLVESSEVNIYKTREFILDSIICAEYVKGILPNTFALMDDKLNELIDKNREIELLVSEELYSNFLKNLNIKPNLKIDCFKNNSDFSLIITDKVMILSLSNLEGVFDQNIALVSKEVNGKQWAQNLFNVFKKGKF